MSCSQKSIKGYEPINEGMNSNENVVLPIKNSQQRILRQGIFWQKMDIQFEPKARHGAQHRLQNEESFHT